MKGAKTRLVNPARRGITKSFWTVPDLDGLQLIHSDFTDHVFPRHYHDTYVIGFHDVGGEEFRCRGVSHVSLAGSVILINPGEAHAGHSADGGTWIYRGLYPSENLLRGLAGQLAGRGQNAPFFPATVVYDPRLAGSLLEAHRALETERCSLEGHTRLLLTLARLITRYADAGYTPKPAGRETRAVRAARDYIEAHYAENPSLGDLSSVTGLNPFYLVRVFRAEVGLPPHEYLTQVRVGRAMKLLSRGTPIADVALETGFVDQSHLTSRFRRIVGVTPKQFALGATPCTAPADGLCGKRQ